MVVQRHVGQYCDGSHLDFGEESPKAVSRSDGTIYGEYLEVPQSLFPNGHVEA